MKRLMVLLLSTIVVVIANILATKLYLYYTTWWADVVMHFLGGFWMVSAAAAFAYAFRRDLSVRTAIAVALVVGIGWEGFEYWLNLIDSSQWADSLSDLVLDVVGGLVAYRLIDERPVVAGESTAPIAPSSPSAIM